MHGVERRLDKRKREPRERIGVVVPMTNPELDHSLVGNAPFVRKRTPSTRRRGFEPKRLSVRKRQTRRCSDLIERGNCGNIAAAAKRIEPGCVRDESSVHRESDRDRTGSSHRPASDIAMTTTMKTTITSSAIFHGLLGYSPAIAPVTPFIAH